MNRSTAILAALSGALLLAGCKDTTGPGPTDSISIVIGHALSVGDRETCTSVPGQLYCWGWYGPTVPTPAQSSIPGTIKSVTVGSNHGCAVTSDGTGYCWGANNRAQLGRGTLDSYGTSAAAPIRVPNVKFMASGDERSCAIDAGGRVWCWGVSLSGVLDFTTNAADQIIPILNPMPPAATVTVAYRHACALTERGKAFCWGSNTDGMLGVTTPLNSCVYDDPSYGTVATSCSSVPLPVDSTLTFQSISAGTGHTCGTTTSGDLYCWGRSFGLTPTRVAAPVPLQSVSAGASADCALALGGGRLYCWGSSATGEMGRGAAVDSSAVPVPVGPPHTFLEVAVGPERACAATVEGEIWCWGRNYAGEIGTGSNTPSLITVPTRVWPRAQ